MTAGEIAEAFPLALFNHFRAFQSAEYAGLVVTERQGTNIVYSLNTSALEEAVAAVLEFAGRGKSRKGEEPMKTFCSF